MKASDEWNATGKKVEEQAELLGFDLVGIAAAADPEFDRAPAGHKPVKYPAGAGSVIVGGIEVIDEMLPTTLSHFSGYPKSIDLPHPASGRHSIILFERQGHTAERTHSG